MQCFDKTFMTVHNRKGQLPYKNSQCSVFVNYTIFVNNIHVKMWTEKNTWKIQSVITAVCKCSPKRLGYLNPPTLLTCTERYPLHIPGGKITSWPFNKLFLQAPLQWPFAVVSLVSKLLSACKAGVTFLFSGDGKRRCNIPSHHIIIPGEKIHLMAT